MNKEQTAIQVEATMWWDKLPISQQIAKMVKNGCDPHKPLSYTQITHFYLAEHPTAPTVEENNVDELPINIKKMFIEDAKAYASKGSMGIIINNPDKYKAFRDGQESAFRLMKQNNHFKP